MHQLGRMKKCVNCSTNLIIFLLSKLRRVIFPLTEINLPNHVIESTPSVMILVPELPRLVRNKHEAGTSVLIQPLGHQLINCIDPRWDEIWHHVLVHSSINWQIPRKQLCWSGGGQSKYLIAASISSN